jgi:hypothetical protein
MANDFNVEYYKAAAKLSDATPHTDRELSDLQYDRQVKLRKLDAADAQWQEKFNKTTQEFTDKKDKAEQEQAAEELARRTDSAGFVHASPQGSPYAPRHQAPPKPAPAQKPDYDEWDDEWS